MKIRIASKNDLHAINEIYNYYVLNSTCTYQTELETIENRTAWFEEHGQDYPVIVAEEGPEIIGWASISRFHKRSAYRFTVENSVYVRKDSHGKKIGTSLLSQLIDISRNKRYRSIIASISSDQEMSIRLHEKFGFDKVGHFKEVGYKFDKWLDVVYYQLIL